MRRTRGRRWEGGGTDPIFAAGKTELWAAQRAVTELGPEAALPAFVAQSPTAEFWTREKSCPFLPSLVEKVLTAGARSLEPSYAFVTGRKVFAVEALGAEVTSEGSAAPGFLSRGQHLGADGGTLPRWFRCLGTGRVQYVVRDPVACACEQLLTSVGFEGRRPRCLAGEKSSVDL